MKRSIIVLVVLILVVIVRLAYSQGRPPQPNATGSVSVPATIQTASSRYQLTTATAQYQAKGGGEADEQHLFLLDSQTGRVWSYQHAITPHSKDGAPIGPTFPAYFESVPADQLNGWEYLEAMKKWGATLNLGQLKKDQPPQ